MVIFVLSFLIAEILMLSVSYVCCIFYKLCFLDLKLRYILCALFRFSLNVGIEGL